MIHLNKENYKLLNRKLENKKNWKILPCAWIRSIGIKISMLYKILHSYHNILNKMSKQECSFLKATTKNDAIIDRELGQTQYC